MCCRRAEKLAFSLLMLTLVWPAVPAPALDEIRTDSRNRYVHRLTLYDQSGRAVNPADQPAKPYSPRATCGKCHDYGRISGGWHFNAPDRSAGPGRPGEPWLLADPDTRTLLAVSSRPWAGTWRPADAGLTPWRFVLRFGRHLPGGGPGEPPGDRPADPDAQWKLAGRLEIDCMICHSAAADYDPDERAAQLARLNFKWAPTAAMGLASVRGSARDADRLGAPPSGQIDLGEFDPAATGDSSGPPVNVRVVYDRSRFDADDRVFFDITRRPPPQRCYVCHSARRVGPSPAEPPPPKSPLRLRRPGAGFGRAGGPGAPPQWKTDEDVHLVAGLTCTDCHRNDLSHMMVRGYEGESVEQGRLRLATLTCRGCHLGEQTSPPPEGFGGRLAAPRPTHGGMPDLHLERLTCTACHSGPWPSRRAGRVQTSMAHGLGLAAAKSRSDELPPAVLAPVFIRRTDGQIAPHRMVWPAFWARESGKDLRPLPPEQVLKAGGDVFESVRKAGPWPALSEEQIVRALELLGEGGGPGERVCYVAGGRIYRRDGKGRLTIGRGPAAAPYCWPIAHDVRPAAQSLGSGGCADCHSRGAAFFFGGVAPDPPPPGGGATTRPMHELAGVDPRLMTVWAISFKFRPIFLWVGFACTGVLAAIFVRYALLGLAALTRR